MTQPPGNFQRTARGGNHAGRAGLTLVGIVMVMAIRGVLSAIAIPRYSMALARYRASAAGQRVAADLSLAQTLGKTNSAG